MEVVLGIVLTNVGGNGNGTVVVGSDNDDNAGVVAGGGVCCGSFEGVGDRIAGSDAVC